MNGNEIMTKKVVLKDHAGAGYLKLTEIAIQYMTDYADRKARPGFRKSLVVYTVGDYAFSAYWTEGGAVVVISSNQSGEKIGTTT